MFRKLWIKTVLVFVIAAIIYIEAGQYQEASSSSVGRIPVGPELSADMLYTELLRQKESLSRSVSELRDELADKRNELAGLDRQLSELEVQYNELLAESKRIADRLEVLKGVQQ